MERLCSTALAGVLTVLSLSGLISAKEREMGLSFCCRGDNDLYVAVTSTDRRHARYNTPEQAVENAAPGTGVLILADGYPEKTTPISSDLLAKSREKHLRLYIEYPSAVPGMTVGEPRQTAWERMVVASDAFGDALPKLRILTAHECRFLPIPDTGGDSDRRSGPGSESGPTPLLVMARVAGFDRAVYGLPETSWPILFEMPGQDALIATTKLSNIIAGRYAPYGAWKTVWKHILAWLDRDAERPSLEWSPTVRPAYEPDAPLPKDFETRALAGLSDWYRNSRLLIHPSREAGVHEMLRSGAEVRPTPGPDEPAGDGSKGILEGYASAISPDGSQQQRLPIRSDCNAEVAMALALDWAVRGSTWSRDVARNLLDYVFFTSGMHGRERGNPRHPAFGHVAWGNIAPAWEVANYSDDDARVILSSIAVSACLGSDRWDEHILRSLLANLRTTGTLGFRGDRIDMPQIEANGWKPYHDREIVNYSPHHESYLWACNLWAYKQTGYKPFIERTKTAIRMTMEAFPDGWRWNDSIERARMLLCLAWLVRLEDAPEHRKWLDTIADSLIERQDPCGAIQERFPGNRTGFQLPQSNEEYGTTEMPLIQQTGDPVSDQLYTTGFALLGFHEAYAATADRRLKRAEDRLTEYLCRIQVRSEKHPYLNGCWFRAFDYRTWEYWAASGDVGWGAWSAESGWAPAWTGAVLGLRLKGTSLWDLTAGSGISSQFRKVREQMAENDGSAWASE